MANSLMANSLMADSLIARDSRARGHTVNKRQGGEKAEGAGKLEKG